jgi:hypothetical protein
MLLLLLLSRLLMLSVACAGYGRQLQDRDTAVNCEVHIKIIKKPDSATSGASRAGAPTTSSAAVLGLTVLCCAVAVLAQLL